MRLKNLFVTLAATAMAISLGGVAVATFAQKSDMVSAASTTVASFSRSSATDTVTGGTLGQNLSGKSGYYQDGPDTTGTVVYYLQISNSSTALFGTSPSSITLSATLGGGTTKSSGVGMNAVLLDSAGATLGDPVLLTDAITSTTGSVFSINFPVSSYASVYGVKIYHTKIAGYNVRYYALSLSWSDTFQQYLEIGTLPTKTTYSVGDEFDTTGLVVRKYTATGVYANVTNYSTSPAQDAVITATTGLTVTVTSLDAGVTSASFTILLNLNCTEASSLTDSLSPASGNSINLPGTYQVFGTVKTLVDVTKNRYVITDGTTDVYCFGYTPALFADVGVGTELVLKCTVGAFAATPSVPSTNGKAELSNLSAGSATNTAVDGFVTWMLSSDRDLEDCSVKWSSAQTSYAALTAGQQDLFKTYGTSTNLVAARARYNAWAVANGNTALSAGAFATDSDSSSLAELIVLLSFLTLGCGAAFLAYRKRKQAN